MSTPNPIPPTAARIVLERALEQQNAAQEWLSRARNEVLKAEHAVLMANQAVLTGMVLHHCERADEYAKAIGVNFPAWLHSNGFTYEPEAAHSHVLREVQA